MNFLVKKTLASAMLHGKSLLLIGICGLDKPKMTNDFDKHSYSHGVFTMLQDPID